MPAKKRGRGGRRVMDVGPIDDHPDRQFLVTEMLAFRDRWPVPATGGRPHA